MAKTKNATARQASDAEMRNGVNTFYAESRNAWRRWLQKHHETEKNVWLIIYKKNTTTPSVYYDEAVEEALCFGWIDSKPNKRDADSYYQFFGEAKSEKQLEQSK